MPSIGLDLFKTPGFRLDRFEVLNWGTFDQRVWRIATGGENALLTGDIGSGKSTLVDALTTLLVPAHRIVFNKAAGAETRERSLASYVRGHYKSEKDDERLAAKAVALRGLDSYSVILACFRNDHYDETVTLAQVFWMKDEKGQPERFHLTATSELTIARDFSGFGEDIKELGRRLRKMPGVSVYDSFPPYGQDFRRRMGLAGEQALELFYQTVSMKAVTNITDFVRHHMLEDPAIAPRIDELCRLFDNLNATHEAVLKAEAQIARLAPLVDNCDRYEQLSAGTAVAERLREALPAWFAQRKSVLLEELITRLVLDGKRLEDDAAQQQSAIDQLHQRRAEVNQAIHDQGGGRIKEIENQVGQREQEKARRKAAFDGYAEACRKLELPRAQSLDTFHDNRRHGLALGQQFESEKAQLTQQRDSLIPGIHAIDQECNGLSHEITSLKQRKSNIPSPMLLLREALCAALGVAETELPFAGELIQVRADENLWEGAIERVLHGFGLSLLVREDHYQAVAGYVDRTHLGGRLVYFRAGGEGRAASAQSPHSLASKIEIKSGSPFRPWLADELVRGYDYACCDSLEEFRRHPKALTRQGQTRSGGARHEKDDRHRLDDRSRYVLGWSNSEKIRVLEELLLKKQAEGDALIARRGEIETALKLLEARQEAIGELLRPEEFTLIDWPHAAAEINSLLEEKRALEESSDILRELNARLESINEQMKSARKRHEEVLSLKGKRAQECEDAELSLRDGQATLAQLPQDERDFCFAILPSQEIAAEGKPPTTPRQCDEAEKSLANWLYDHIKAEKDKAARIASNIAAQMQEYIGAYPAECREVNASLDSAAEFRRMLEHLQSEDLPRFKAKFKELLNKNTIHEVALLQDKLEGESDTIRKKIDAINRSLRLIEYNPATYIQLVPDPDPDMEIRQFKEDLKGCLAHSLAGADDEPYTEHRFVLVKRLIDRFNGRADDAEIDRRWTRKVTDVRNWFRFSASERWREDGAEKEFYSDSAGKSGGQKEKLAYTILASALSYQYGIDRHNQSARAFRFVMIDEAFGRGSDESARYGLELFAKLELQLLIVTPLQKIHVIENYVRSVHLVHNEEGRNSMIRSLTIDEYREEKAHQRATS
ncbi:MAG: ATP-dependent exonuclease SbcCD, C subunit-like protein [Sulfuricellaceae bacterium]|nr:ATP-dependent exonuclease SbcCD, C subunit-like protein [Sulfuricellaceae bacterium]